MPRQRGQNRVRRLESEADEGCVLFQGGAWEALLETSGWRAEQGESGCPVDNQGKVFQAEEIAHTKALRQEQAWCVKERTRRLVWPGHRSEGKAAGRGSRSMGDSG